MPAGLLRSNYETDFGSMRKDIGNIFLDVSLFPSNQQDILRKKLICALSSN